MISQTLAGIAARNAEIPLMACAGLLIFAFCFLGVLVWVSRPSLATRYENLSRMPLENEVKS
ncbi:MAG: cbb3-type cytochrome c oxidase subunit 3 [Bdellovibrionales bacterium]|nr:cbb3-type cytochrome c oxidase subunit 3 [Bdellovibrionales bacterium]